MKTGSNKRDTLAGKLQRIKPIPLAGTFFRSVSAKHANQLLSVQGSLEHGGRYNPAGEFGALYMSNAKETCKAEAARKAREGLLVSQVTGKIKVKLTKVLDLTGSKNLQKVDIEKEDLIIEKNEGGWDLTWAIARWAYLKGYEAILSPSITGQGDNLIIFDKCLDKIKIKLTAKA